MTRNPIWKRLTRWLLIACLGTAASISGSVTAEPQSPAGDIAAAARQVLVKVDDFDLTALHLALYAGQSGLDPNQPAEQIRLLSQLVNNFVVAQSPEGQAIAARPEIAAELEAQREKLSAEAVAGQIAPGVSLEDAGAQTLAGAVRDISRALLITQAFVRSAMAAAPVDEASVQALYDHNYGGQPQREYKARHILVETRDAALEVIEALDGGTDFATLARDRSTGPSGASGGDLGWFEAEQMVEPFAIATAQLADGEYSRDPVKTPFGWHVILREQSRELPKPRLDDVRAELEQEIRQRTVNEQLVAMRERSHIEVQRLENSD